MYFIFCASQVALLTQALTDACMSSLQADGAKVELGPAPKWMSKDEDDWPFAVLASSPTKSTHSTKVAKQGNESEQDICQC